MGTERGWRVLGTGCGGMGMVGCIPDAPGSLAWHSRSVTKEAPLPRVSESLPPLPELKDHPSSAFPEAAAPVPWSGSPLL